MLTTTAARTGDRWATAIRNGSGLHGVTEGDTLHPSPGPPRSPIQGIQENRKKIAQFRLTRISRPLSPPAGFRSANDDEGVERNGHEDAGRRSVCPARAVPVPLAPSRSRRGILHRSTPEATDGRVRPRIYYITPRLADNFGNGLSSYFPLMVRDPNPIHAGDPPTPNTSAGAEGYLAAIGADHEALFFHIVATLHSPAYRAENQGALKQDWPRIPLPASKSVLVASAALGREVAALLDPEGVLPKQAKALKSVGPITAAEGTLDPDVGDLELTVGWGHAGKGGVTMPAKGKITLRAMTLVERGAMPEGAIGILGEQTCDVWLNERAYWRNIPLRVWEYSLGGYQVIKKWLSYREKELLDRSLTVEEARYITETARRIAAILLLSPALDVNYCAAKQATSALAKAAEA